LPWFLQASCNGEVYEWTERLISYDRDTTLRMTKLTQLETLFESTSTNSAIVNSSGDFLKTRAHPSPFSQRIPQATYYSVPLAGLQKMMVEWKGQWSDERVLLESRRQQGAEPTCRDWMIKKWRSELRGRGLVPNRSGTMEIAELDFSLSMKHCPSNRDSSSELGSTKWNNLFLMDLGCWLYFAWSLLRSGILR
jgi:hypothetical protein